MTTKFFKRAHCGMVLYFIPLIIMAGRLAGRVVMNLWNIIEK